MLNPLKLNALQIDVIETLCKFEISFTPSFLYKMAHLIVHLVRKNQDFRSSFLYRGVILLNDTWKFYKKKVRKQAQPISIMM